MTRATVTRMTRRAGFAQTLAKAAAERRAASNETQPYRAAHITAARLYLSLAALDLFSNDLGEFLP